MSHTNPHPKLFIGSSWDAKSAGLLDALESSLKAGLKGKVDVVRWDKLPEWINMKAYVDTLVRDAWDYSYAVFILSADDPIETRHGPRFTGRDNVLFEYGLFLSHLGSSRTFLIAPKDQESTIATKNIRVRPKAGMPHDQRELKVLSDLCKVHLQGKYTVTGPGPSVKIKFDVDDVVSSILKQEEPLDQSQATKRLNGAIDAVHHALVEDKHSDSHYIGKFSTHIRELATYASEAHKRSIQNVVSDLLLFFRHIPDLCDVTQLADIQRKGKDKDIAEVWVFAETPLEFSAAATQDVAVKMLRKTIHENLLKGVKYVYFVGPEFKPKDLDMVVPRTHRWRDKSLKNVEVIMLPSSVFNTFFTIHFDTPTGHPTAVYMSSVMRERKDLLIQIANPEHVSRIHKRVNALRGEVTEHKAQIKSHVV